MNTFEKAQELVKGKGELLFVSEFGSRLYGTNTPNSDHDLKGIFLPSLESLALGEAPRSLHHTTGDNHSRNGKDDVDIELWSLQHFLNLLGKTETGAVDLLFSMKAEHVQKKLFRDFLPEIKNPCSLFNLRESRSFVSYAYSQAKKYGLRGSRVGLLQEVLGWLKEKNPDPEERAASVFPELVEKFWHPSYCFLKEHNNSTMLFFLGKGYDAHIRVSEMQERLQRTYDTYGERAKMAQENEGIDWKALSHALRCCHQMQELIRTGEICFPLKTSELLKQIKSGELPWTEVEQLILNALEDVETIIQGVEPNPGFRKLHREIILRAYAGKGI